MKKADLILVAVTVAVAGALLLLLYGVNSNSGAYVQIEIDGAITETLPLDTDTAFEIITDGGGKNLLVIEDGNAKVTEANCPEGICKNHAEIHRNGESIICLPHKVVITVVNETDRNGIDAAA